MRTIWREDIPRDVCEIITKLNSAGYEAYIVGGCVRDLLLGNTPHDWDITTSATPAQVHDVFSGDDVRDTGTQHGTVTIVLNGVGYEVTTFRTESVYSDGRHPDSVEFSISLRDDLARRDFTINAMAYDVANEHLIDCYGGKEDLRNGIIRCVGMAGKRFEEDYLRILRALRFASRYEFDIDRDTGTESAMFQGKNNLQYISAERLREELTGLLCGKGARTILTRYFQILEVVIPEVGLCVGFDQNNPYHLYDVWKHSSIVVGNVPNDLILRWAAFFHDIGKPFCYQEDESGQGHFKGHGHVSAKIAYDTMTRLRFSNADRDRITLLVDNHDYFVEESKKAVRRLMHKIGPENMDAFLAIRKADILGQNPVYAEARLAKVEQVRNMAKEIIAEQQCLSMKDLAINGRDLIELGFKAGPKLGRCLKQLLDEVLEDETRNTKQYLLTRASEFLPESSGTQERCSL